MTLNWITGRRWMVEWMLKGLRRRDTRQRLIAMTLTFLNGQGYNNIPDVI